MNRAAILLRTASAGPNAVCVAQGRLFASKSGGEEKSGEEGKGSGSGGSWISRTLFGHPINPDGAQKQSHSSLLSVSEYIYELTTHNYRPGEIDNYLKAFGAYKSTVEKVLPSTELVGSWTVAFGRTKDQAVHLWRHKQGYKDIDRSIDLLASDASLKAADKDVAQLCSRRRDVLMKSFSYWGEPEPRAPSHVYDLRSYVLKPGSMIEWGNSWAKGITYRREHNQDVGGFFAQVGQLYIVTHIWAYPSMAARNDTRQSTWAKPGWDATVAYTVPLIKKMQSKILTPTEYSQLK